MLGRIRAGAKFFTVGVLVGLMFAPESGESLRQRLVSDVGSLVRSPFSDE